MTEIQGLKPEKVFEIFQEISRIPRGSGNTKGISDHCAAFARERGFEAIQDEWNNIIIRKPGTEGYEKSEPVILQGHLDMVCEKTPDSKHDFEKDPLELYAQDGFLKAKDTTLGADDGIAVAFALALLDSRDIPHPPLELLFTTDEETGMDGALNVDMSLLKGRMLLNIDSEEEGVLTVGCAGGCVYRMTQKIRREAARGEELKIVISGLHGGHSGVEISGQYGNAHKMAGRLLNRIRQKTAFSLIEVDGGRKENVIPSHCVIRILARDTEAVLSCVREMETLWKAEFGTDEPDLELRAERMGEREAEAICEEDAEKAIFYLNACPNGVYEYSRHLEGMVETSCNLGQVETKEDRIVYGTLIRSSLASKTEELKERFRQWTQMLGEGCTESISGEYPSWEYREDSRLREAAASCYREIYGKEPVILSIHAGLECGILQDKKKDLDGVSIGPDILDIHSVNERLDIASVQRTWEYIKAILKALK